MQAGLMHRGLGHSDVGRGGFPPNFPSFCSYIRISVVIIIIYYRRSGKSTIFVAADDGFYGDASANVSRARPRFFLLFFFESTHVYCKR